MTMPDHNFPDHMPPPKDAHDDTTRSDESALIARVRAGDAEAFTAVVRAHAKPMARFAYAFVQSWDTADDVVQTVLVQLWEGRASLDPALSLQAYLYRLVRNRALNEQKFLAIRARHRTQVQASIVTDPSSVTVVSPEGQVLDRATLATVIRRLPQQRRLALELRYTDQLSFQEIGEVLGISTDAAKKLVIRALQDLRKFLGVSL